MAAGGQSSDQLASQAAIADGQPLVAPAAPGMRVSAACAERWCASVVKPGAGGGSALCMESWVTHRARQRLEWAALAARAHGLHWTHVALATTERQRAIHGLTVSRWGAPQMHCFGVARPRCAAGRRDWAENHSLPGRIAVFV